jgi:hypothetical protein
MSQALRKDNLAIAGCQILAKKLDINNSVIATVIAEDANGNCC